MLIESGPDRPHCPYLLRHKTTVRTQEGCAQWKQGSLLVYRGPRTVVGADAVGAEAGMPPPLGLGLALPAEPPDPNDGLYVSREYPTDGDAGGAPR